MTHLRLRNENSSEHFEVTTQADSPSDSPINHALIAMAQEVTELLKTCLSPKQKKLTAHWLLDENSKLFGQ